MEWNICAFHQCMIDNMNTFAFAFDRDIDQTVGFVQRQRDMLIEGIRDVRIHDMALVSMAYARFYDK